MDNEGVAVLQIRLTRRNRFAVLALGLLCLRPPMLGSEKLTLTTYYPAPYGAYVSILTTRQTLLARDSGNVGIGIRLPLGKLHVRGNGNVIFDTTGSMGIGTTSPTAKTGVDDGTRAYLDVKDVWLRDVEKWASELGGGLPDTGQTSCYKGNGTKITCPDPGNDLAQDGSYKPPARQPKYTDNGNGTITDKLTGLIWKKCTEGRTGNDCSGGSYAKYVWEDALKACERLTFTDYSDWRLPNSLELSSLIIQEADTPYHINQTYFPNIPSSRSFYWTSTTYMEGPTGALVVDFELGSVAGKADTKTSTEIFTRCVRG